MIAQRFLLGAGMWAWRRLFDLHRCERAEALEYLMVFVGGVMPMVIAARLAWAVLVQYHAGIAMIVDSPFL